MLSIQSISHHYVSAPEAALNEVSLQIPTGCLFGLLGPNGAGKTTLLSLLSGQLPLSEGDIEFDGKPFGSVAAREYSLVPQENAFYAELTVAKNLQFFASVQGADKRDIERVVALAQLQERLSSKSAELSGGLKRRLNLAIGLLNQPRLLLLDEPTVGIDPHSRAFLLTAIRELADAGTTVIYTSHYMEEVEQICDEIAILDRGRVLAQGSLDSLLRAHASASLSVELAVELPKGAIDGLQDRWNVTVDGRVLTVESAEGSPSFNDLLGQLSALPIDITRVHFGVENLEQLFLHLTHRSLRD